MKKEYVAPEMNLQNFAPNENVAACYLVQCPYHQYMDNNWNYKSYGHAGNGKWHEVSREDMLAGGATESGLDAVDADPNHTARVLGTLNLNLDNEGMMSHKDVQVCWDYDGTNFGS